MLYHCPYCGWQGSEPNIAEYPDTDEGMEQWADDLSLFRQEQDNHECDYGKSLELNMSVGG